MVFRGQSVGGLYTWAEGLTGVNHRKARKFANGTPWHGLCISIGVHTRFPRGRAGALFRSRRPPLPLFQITFDERAAAGSPFAAATLLCRLPAFRAEAAKGDV
jgi:hypothetical protein